MIINPAGKYQYLKHATSGTQSGPINNSLSLLSGSCESREMLVHSILYMNNYCILRLGITLKENE